MYNNNELIKYPIAEDSDTQGLPNSVLVDITIAASVAEPYLVKNIVKTDKLISIVIGTATADKLIGTYLLEDTVNYTAQMLTPLGVDCSGTIVFGDLNLDNFKLDLTEARLVTRCVTYTKAPGVSSIVVQAKKGAISTGFAEFRGDGTVVFERDLEDAQKVNVRLLDMVKADFLGPCDATVNCDPKVLRNLGGAKPSITEDHNIIHLRAVDEFSS